MDRANKKGVFMAAKKAIGRPLKVDYKVIIKLADALQHSANITDACRYARISRDTYYRHLNNEEVFAETMATATDNQTKVVFSFLTVP
jgi:ACT domain-containing protein